MKLELKCTLRGRQSVLRYLHLRKRLGMTDAEFIAYAIRSLMKRIDEA